VLSLNSFFEILIISVAELAIPTESKTNRSLSLKQYSIYRITNIINNKIYIGKTSQNPATRFKQHITESYRGLACALHRAIRKYGEHNFLYDVIFNTINDSDLDEFEQYFILEHNSCILLPNSHGYNMTLGGNDGSYVSKHQRKLIDSGGHHFQTEKFIQDRHDRLQTLVINGTHPFCDKDASSKRALNRVENGTHPSQVERTCPFCGHTGYGTTLIRYHFDNCKQNPNYIPKPKKAMPETTKNALIDSSSRLYEITFPDGHIENIKNLAAFCREQNLPRGSLRDVAQGKKEHVANYKCSYLD